MVGRAALASCRGQSANIQRSFGGLSSSTWQCLMQTRSSPGWRHQFECSRQPISGWSACRDGARFGGCFNRGTAPFCRGPTFTVPSSSAFCNVEDGCRHWTRCTWWSVARGQMQEGHLSHAVDSVDNVTQRGFDDAGSGYASLGLAQLSWCQAQAVLQNSAPGHCPSCTAALAADRKSTRLNSSHWE